MTYNMDIREQQSFPYYKEERKMSEYDEKLNAEIEKRISEMEKPDYEFPQRFSKGDYIFTGVVVGICLIAVIAGAFI